LKKQSERRKTPEYPECPLPQGGNSSTTRFPNDVAKDGTLTVQYK
jgi:hypothetical protein